MRKKIFIPILSLFFLFLSFGLLRGQAVNDVRIYNESADPKTRLQNLNDTYNGGNPYTYMSGFSYVDFNMGGGIRPFTADASNGDNVIQGSSLLHDNVDITYKPFVAPSGEKSSWLYLKNPYDARLFGSTGTTNFPNWSVVQASNNIGGPSWPAIENLSYRRVLPGYIPTSNLPWGYCYEPFGGGNDIDPVEIMNGGSSKDVIMVIFEYTLTASPINGTDANIPGLGINEYPNLFIIGNDGQVKITVKRTTRLFFIPAFSPVLYLSLDGNNRINGIVNSINSSFMPEVTNPSTVLYTSQGGGMNFSYFFQPASGYTPKDIATLTLDVQAVPYYNNYYLGYQLWEGVDYSGGAGTATYFNARYYWIEPLAYQPVPGQPGYGDGKNYAVQFRPGGGEDNTGNRLYSGTTAVPVNKFGTYQFTTNAEYINARINKTTNVTVNASPLATNFPGNSVSFNVTDMNKYSAYYTQKSKYVDNFSIENKTDLFNLSQGSLGWGGNSLDVFSVAIGTESGQGRTGSSQNKGRYEDVNSKTVGFQPSLAMPGKYSIAVARTIPNGNTYNADLSVEVVDNTGITLKNNVSDYTYDNTSAAAIQIADAGTVASQTAFNGAYFSYLKVPDATFGVGKDVFTVTATPSTNALVYNAGAKTWTFTPSKVNLNNNTQITFAVKVTRTVTIGSESFSNTQTVNITVKRVTDVSAKNASNSFCILDATAYQVDDNTNYFDFVSAPLGTFLNDVFTASVSPTTTALYQNGGKWYFKPSLASSGNYTVTLTRTITSNVGESYASSISTNFYVSSTAVTPTLSVIQPQGGCTGGVATLSVTNPGQGYTYNWYEGTSTTPFATGTSVPYTVSKPSTVFTCKGVLTGLCASTASAQITVNSGTPIADFTADKTSVDAGQPLILTATTVLGATYVWDFGDGDFGTFPQSLKFYYKDGAYTVKLTVTGTNGCSATVTKTGYITIGSNAKFGNVGVVTGLSINDRLDGKLLPYPNPTETGLIKIGFGRESVVAKQQYINAVLTDSQGSYIQGRQIDVALETESFGENGSITVFDIPNLAEGLYILSLSAGDEVVKIRIIKR